MITFEKFQLDNGLKVILHRDESTPIVAINTLYNVGARDEDPDKTGFAHLFEHLMFGGSVNIPVYDEPLQMVGGENNAFTNNDITNYYLTLPKNNIETGFWLESDRMLSLAFTDKALEVQRSVVIEEFKQRYLNQPYGDVWLLLRPLVYTVHPYKWPTIGKDIAHIENATMDDVKAFFKRFYSPNNAIMSIAGNIDAAEIKELVHKWFGSIPPGSAVERVFIKEPPQAEPRSLTVERNVPLNAIYKAWRACSRIDKEFYALDLITDIFSRGHSSRFYNNLIKGKELFSEVDAYITGDLEDGLFVIAGKLLKGVTVQQAEEAILEELELLKKEPVSETELNKVKNKAEATLVFSEMNVLNKAMNLAYAELMGDAELINEEGAKYHAVTVDEITNEAKKIFREENCSTLYYLSNKPLQ